MAFIVAGVLVTAAFALGTSTTAPVIVGASPKQRALLHQILSGLGPTDLTEIVLRDPRPTSRRYLQGGITIQIAGLRDDSSRTHWQASIIAGAFRDGSTRRGLPRVVFYEAKGFGGGGFGRIAGKGIPPPPLGRPADSRLQEEVESALAAAGPLSIAVTVRHPYGPVLELVLGVDDLARFLRNRMGAVLKALRSHETDGWYLTLSAGDEQATFYDTTRLDSFGAKIPPRLRGCVKFVRMGPGQPPPCPV